MTATAFPKEQVKETPNDENQATSPKGSRHYQHIVFLVPGRLLVRDSDFHLDSETRSAYGWNGRGCAHGKASLQPTLGDVMDDDFVPIKGH